MKKIDLKNGNVVELRDGSVFVLIDDNFVNLYTGYIRCLDFYENDLTRLEWGLHVMKVYLSIYDYKKREVMWKRKDYILDRAEKEYLSNFIKPFRDKVLTIKRCKSTTYNCKDYLDFTTKDCSFMLPYYDGGTMYQGMEYEKRYTLEELGL